MSKKSPIPVHGMPEKFSEVYLAPLAARPAKQQRARSPGAPSATKRGAGQGTKPPELGSNIQLVRG